jgi:hypothetical protein
MLVALQQSKSSIDLSHLPKGMHLLKTSSPGGKIYVKKAVIECVHLNGPL